MASTQLESVGWFFERRHAVTNRRLALSVNDANKFRNSFFSACGRGRALPTSPSLSRSTLLIHNVEMKQTHAAFLPVHTRCVAYPLPLRALPSLPPSLSSLHSDSISQKREESTPLPPRRRREIPLFLSLSAVECSGRIVGAHLSLSLSPPQRPPLVHSLLERKNRKNARGARGGRGCC